MYQSYEIMQIARSVKYSVLIYGWKKFPLNVFRIEG